MAATQTTPPSFTFSIDMYADTVCVWSYIGSKILDQAIDAYKSALPPDERDKVTFDLTWRPYVLYPNAGVSVRTKKDAIHKIYSLNAPSIFSRLESLTKQYQIPLVWEGSTGNSINSHKLILLAIEQDEITAAYPQPPSSPLSPLVLSDLRPNPPPSRNITTSSSSSHPLNDTTLNLPSRTEEQRKKSKQAQVIETLFQESWTRSTDISHPPSLYRIAVSTGLLPSEAAAAEYLDNNSNPAAAEAVHASSAYGKTVTRITAVPSYVVNGRWQVGGMQDLDTWLDLFHRIRESSSSSSSTLTSSSVPPSVLSSNMNLSSDSGSGKGSEKGSAGTGTIFVGTGNPVSVPGGTSLSVSSGASTGTATSA